MPELDKSRQAQYRQKVTENFPDKLVLPGFNKKLSLRYGQNPGAPAALYVEEGASGPNMSYFVVLKEGKGLGYINVGDMDLGQRIIKKMHGVFSKPVCAVIKHEIPSGVGMGDNAIDAFTKAWYCDSLSAFGSVDAFSCEVDADVAKLLVEPSRNIEVVYAPAFTSEALEILQKREPMRVVKMAEISLPAMDNGLEYKRVAGGLLVENRYDTKITSPEYIDCISDRKATADEVAAAIFNWIVAGFTRSNAVVIGTKEKTHGVGSGQMSRIDSAHMAIYKANGRNGIVKDSYGARGSVMASDAYMPETDVVNRAADEGMTAIVYPLGSNKDKDVLDVANKKGLAMLITRKPGDTAGGERCFLHR
jgi:phosphoribosylaminoimidazolecarboxamide formyltransferase/IMP cyclohydrolase